MLLLQISTKHDNGDEDDPIMAGTKSTMKKGNYSKITWNDSILCVTPNTVLLSSVGAQAFTKIKSQLKPENLTDKSYDEVVAAHGANKQQLTVIGRRNQFMNRNRKQSASVSQYDLA